jgi:hypothetical protein
MLGLCGWKSSPGGSYNFRRAAHCFASFIQSDAAWEDLAEITVIIESRDDLGQTNRLKKKKSTMFSMRSAHLARNRPDHLV